MTSGATKQPWYVRPAIMLPLVFGFIVLVAVLTPEDVTGRAGDDRLTTYSTAPQAAQGLYELARRLGWKVSRRTAPLPTSADSTTIEAVLAPAVALTAAETRALLAHVRQGGALLFVYDGSRGLADSLHVRLGNGNSYTPVLRDGDAEDARKCPPNVSLGLPLWLGERPLLNSVRWTRPTPPDTVTFAIVTVPGRKSEPQPAAVGFAFGRGRIVAIADPDLLRNDVIRNCDWNTDVVAVRMLEYLSGGASARRDHIEFDEYHQGYGLHPGTMRAITVYLGRTRSGHVLGQLALAGLVLLLAVGPRALPPRDDSHLERRSPLEHVDALSRAYAQVGASRTATAHLLHGVRRRLRRTGRGALDTPDETFLEQAAGRAPALSSDVALVRHALNTRVTRHELEAVGAALRRVESVLTTFPQ